MPRVDLNCDLGEGAGHDADLMPLITSANIACGAHAGDAATMRATVALALQHGVAIGAHPGFADREDFGRRELPLSGTEAGKLVLKQIQDLQGIAAAAGGGVNHVKLHGALYHMASRDRDLAQAVAGAVRASDRNPVMVVLAGSILEQIARTMGVRTASEVFADRTYQPDGSLTPRDRPGALIADAGTAVAQVLRMIKEGKVRATDGRDVAIRADTVCLHGDGPRAVEFARAIRQGLLAAGIEVRRPGA